MSELTKEVRKMLSQAAGFAKDAPLEAVSRAKLALRTARAGLERAQGEEREQLQTLCEVAESRIEKYDQQLDAWQGQVKERANLFLSHEHQRLQQPLPPKV